MGKCSHGISKISKKLNFARCPLARHRGCILRWKNHFNGILPACSDQVRSICSTFQIEKLLRNDWFGKQPWTTWKKDVGEKQRECLLAVPQRQQECDNRPVCWSPICSFEGLWPTPIQTRSPVFKWIVWTVTTASHFTTETGNFWNPETSHIWLCLSTSDTTSWQEVTTVASFPFQKSN